MADEWEGHDSWPGICAERAEKDLEEAQAKIVELQAALEKYGDHLEGCDLSDTYRCGCGFDEARGLREFPLEDR